MNFLIAIVIGVVVGAIVGFALRGRNPRALTLAPILGAVGALLASVLATLVGDPGYGWKEATLQVVLAAAGAGAVALIPTRRSTTAV